MNRYIINENDSIKDALVVLNLISADMQSLLVIDEKLKFLDENYFSKYEKAENYCDVIKENNLNIIYNDQVKSVYHGMLAPYFIKKELNITDVEILSAIEWHVTGKENMSPLEKIIYVSDYVEDLREGETYAISRKIAEVNLDACVAYNSRSILQYLLEKKYAIFSSSIATYNYYIKYFDDYESK